VVRGRLDRGVGAGTGPSPVTRDPSPVVRGTGERGGGSREEGQGWVFKGKAPLTARGVGSRGFGSLGLMASDRSGKLT